MEIIHVISVAIALKSLFLKTLSFLKKIPIPITPLKMVIIAEPNPTLAAASFLTFIVLRKIICDWVIAKININ